MTVSYVYFIKETEEIASISNYKKDTELPFVEVPESLVKPIMIGRELLRDYKVYFDIKLSEYVFTAKMDLHEPVSTTWDSSIYNIPIVKKDENFDILVIRENRNWKIKPSQKVKDAFGKNKDSPYHYFELYITEKDDANILLFTLPIKSLDLIENDQIVFKNVDITGPASVYCKKIFENYGYLIKDEN